MDLKQNHNEDEEAYSARLCEAFHRCGNVYDDSQKMTFFVNGLSRDIQSIVARHRESTPRQYMRYKRLVSFARDEGQAHRARLESAHSILKRTNPNSALRNANVSFLGEPEATQPVPTSNNQQLLLLGGGQPDTDSTQASSVPTSDLPSTLDDEKRQELLAFRTVRPPKISFGDDNTNRNRPGWVDNQKKTICYLCYAVDKHLSPDCNIQLSDLATIVANYESLSEQDRRGLPKTAYNMAKQLLAGIQPNGQPCGNNNNHDGDIPKNS